MSRLNILGNGTLQGGFSFLLVSEDSVEWLPSVNSAAVLKT